MALYSLANQAGALFRAALNTVLGKLQRNYYGTVDPAATGESTAGMWWVDSNLTPPMLKIRNGADNGWISILDLNTTRLYTSLFQRMRMTAGSEGSIDCTLDAARFRYEPGGFGLQFQLGVNQCFINASPRPLGVSGGFALGDASARWSTAFLVTAPNVSSDWQLKEGFADYTETDLAAARLIKPQTFRMKASGKGSSGYVAQQILDAFDQAGSTHERPVELGLMEMGEDGMWGVHYELVNALRIEALSR